MLLPTTVNPSYSISITARWKTVVSQYDSGRQQRRQKQVQDIYDANIKYNRLTLANMGILWDFYQSCRGSLYDFYLYDLEENRRAWTDLYVGIGDGATITFDLPGKNTSSRSIKFNGSTQTSGISYSTGTGAESADTVTFTIAPAAGVIVTASFTGDLRIKCHFKEDKLTRENFAYRLFRTGLDLEGLPVG